MTTEYERGFAAGVEAAAQLAEDCIANGITVLSAGEVASALRALRPSPVPAAPSPKEDALCARGTGRAPTEGGSK